MTLDRYFLTFLGCIVPEAHKPIARRKDCMVLAHAHARAYVVLGTSLPNDNVARYHALATVVTNKSHNVRIVDIEGYNFNSVDPWVTILTAYPPNFLTPRRLDSESRPFLVEPPAFFEAQRHETEYTLSFFAPCRVIAEAWHPKTRAMPIAIAIWSVGRSID